MDPSITVILVVSLIIVPWFLERLAYHLVDYKKAKMAKGWKP